MRIVDNIDKIIKIFSWANAEEALKNDAVDRDYKNRDVLVGTVRSRYQFDRLIKMKFYHIPMSQLVGCDMPIKYVAIYQSKKLFGKKSGVNYYGEVESCKTMPRCNIVEIPKNSDELYLYIRIRKWYKLNNKILAKEMDRTAFTTSLFLLKTAKDSTELNLRSEKEYDFYKMLVKTVRNLVINRIPDHADIVFGEYTIKFKNGLLYLYFGEVVQYVIGYDFFLEKPMDVVRDIFDYYPEI